MEADVRGRVRGRVAVIDYGVGNTRSVSSALSRLGYSSVVTDRPPEIVRADVLVLPGVGAFEVAMRNIRTRGLLELLEDEVLEKRKPILGICLGMQVFAENSEENGLHPGLGWIPGRVRRLQADRSLRVPHVGWNEVEASDREVFFTNQSLASPAFYYDHSFHFECESSYRVAWTRYGTEVTAIVQKGNIYGVQFHPEKSQRNGLKLLRSFFDHLGIPRGESC